MAKDLRTFRLGYVGFLPLNKPVSYLSREREREREREGKGGGRAQRSARLASNQRPSAAEAGASEASEEKALFSGGRGRERDEAQARSF
jgi:hypothetical protein